MAKKQYQPQGKNSIKKTGQAKKKRTNVQRSARPVSTEKDITEGAIPPIRTTPRASATAAPTASHAYVVSDLIRPGIIAAIAFIILIILYFVL